MFNLPVIQINEISIANIDELNQKIKESVEFLDNLRLSHDSNFETICSNLKIATDIEDRCKTVVADVLQQTGDINNLISALESMQKEARLIRLDLDKAKKQYKQNKIENYNSIYFNLLITKANEFSAILPKCNIQEEVRNFYSNFILTVFKGVKEQDLDSKHIFNENEVNAYLNNLDFKIKAFNQSKFTENFIPISIKFINADLIIEFNNNEYTALDYDKIKAEYDLLIKIQQEQDDIALQEQLSKQEQKKIEEQKQLPIETLTFSTEETKSIYNTIDEINIQKQEIEEEITRKQILLFKIKNILKNRIDNIHIKDIVKIEADKLSITFIITKEEII
jgi:hypothetical protein